MPMAEKKKSPTVGGPRKPRIPGWLKALDPTPEDLGVWEYASRRDLANLQRIYMNCAMDLRRTRQLRADEAKNYLAEIRRLRAAEADGAKYYQLAAAKQANLGKLQANLMQTLQSMMTTMEGNSRAVHALAEPVGDMLERLGRELDTESGPSWEKGDSQWRPR